MRRQIRQLKIYGIIGRAALLRGLFLAVRQRRPTSAEQHHILSKKFSIGAWISTRFFV
jgi:hypothetical protein